MECILIKIGELTNHGCTCFFLKQTMAKSYRNCENHVYRFRDTKYLQKKNVVGQEIRVIFLLGFDFFFIFK